MQVLTEVSFHGIDRSEAAEAAVLRWVARLEGLHDRMTRCTVMIAQPHRRYRHSEFAVSIVADLPGIEVAAHAQRDDIYIAIADAFRAVRRQLQDRVDVRHHAGRRAS